jgi:hypothetical protein
MQTSGAPHESTSNAQAFLLNGKAGRTFRAGDDHIFFQNLVLNDDKGLFIVCEWGTLRYMI